LYKLTSQLQGKCA